MLGRVADPCSTAYATGPADIGTRLVTAATGLKRLVIAVATVVAAAFATLVALSFLIPTASVRDAVDREIHAVTGLDPVLRGSISVSLFPSGTASFHSVVLGNDRTGQPAVVADELIAHCRKHLTGYKVPRHVEFRATLPKTNIGKILRRSLRADGSQLPAH